jgi:undecaprenyl diphosphate synthase
VTSPSPLPHHVAIIMDGNGRWALGKGRPRTDGHEAGSDALKRTIETAVRYNIPILTVYAFSSENWSRPRSEVRKLLELFLRALNREVRELDEHGVRLRFVGDRSAFNPALRDGMVRAEKRTRNNTRLLLNVAVNYGGHSDIVDAARRLAEAVEQGKLSSEQIDIRRFSTELALGDIPSPDLFIRTGGESRLSNFLLWEMAYTELHFTEVLWPDFDAEHFETALEDYARRERRFGGLGDVRHA